MKHFILEYQPLKNPRRNWEQKTFALSAFCPIAKSMRNAIKLCVNSGFNLIELSGAATHEQAEEAVLLCEENEIDLLFQDFSVFGGFQAKHLDREVSEKTIFSLAERLKQYKHIVGYYVWDEPYVEDQLIEARRQIDMFLAAAPQTLPFSVAIPSYNKLYRWENGEFEAYLRRYVEIIDPPVLSLDYYPIGLRGYTDEMQLDNSLFWCDLSLMRKLGLEYDIPVWFYYQAVNLHNYHRFTFPMVRMMMYSAVMYGFKGLQQFTAVDSVLTEDGEKGPFFDEQKQIHKEFAALGNVLMALHTVHVFHSDDLLCGSAIFEPYRESIEESQLIAAINSPRTSLGELSDSYGNDYIIALNRYYDSAAKLSITFKKPCRVFEVSKITGCESLAHNSTSKLELMLDAGDAILLRLQDPEKEAFTLEYKLKLDS